MKQVVSWFGMITQRAIRRAILWSGQQPIAKIYQFIANKNNSKSPFNWTTTTDSILGKHQRLCAKIPKTQYQPEAGQ